MKWREYLIRSEETMSTEFHCGMKEERLLHAVIGILTEIDELLDNYMGDKMDSINVGEEITDILWYVAIIGREMNIDYPQIVVKSKSDDPVKIILNITKNSCKLLDFVKKKLYYNKEIDENMFK